VEVNMKKLEAMVPLQVKGQAELLIVLFLLLSAVHFSLFADITDAAEAIGKFTHVEGRVDVLKEGKLPAITAKVGDTVSVKDIIRTKSDSKAEVAFNDGNILKLAQRSRIDISEYAFDGVNKAVINLPRGKVESAVDKRVVNRIAASPDANKFEIRTPVAVAGVRGTDYFVFHDRNVTGVLVKDGVVETYNPKFPEVKVTVTAGQITTVAENKPPAPPRAATESEKKGHEKDVAPTEKPKEKAEEKPKEVEAVPPAAEKEKAAPVEMVTAEAKAAPPEEPKPALIVTTTPIVTTDTTKVTTTITETNPQMLTTSIGAESRIKNNSFETGNASDWTLSHSNLTSVDTSFTHSNSGHVYNPVNGNYFLNLITGGGNGVYTKAYQTVTIEDGIVIAGYAAFATHDYSPYDDNAYVKIYNSSNAVVATPWSKKIVNDVGSYGYTQWTKWTWTSTATGEYKIELAVANQGDNAVQSNALFDALSSGSSANFTKIINGTSYLLGKGFTMLIKPDSPSLWTGNPAYINLLGVYSPSVNQYDVWYGNVHSYNYKNNTATTYDGGAYYGFLGGIKMPAAGTSYDTVEGRFTVLYIDLRDSNGLSRAGILKGVITGVAMELMDIDAAIYRTEMNNNIGITPENLIDNISKYSISSGSNTSFAFNGNQMGDAYFRTYSYDAGFSGINSSDWGIWDAKLSGFYNGVSASDNWNWSMLNSDNTEITGVETNGTRWSGNTLKGSNIGYWADTNSIINSAPATGIIVGETFGTFNPNDFTFQAVQTGMWLETRNFLELAAATEAGRTKLQQLNVPAVEVGRATLTGSGNGFTSISMTDTIFFAPSTGAKPQIWATGNVSGSYTAVPAVNTAIPLSGSGLSVDFTFKAWDTTNNRWISTINNGNAPAGIGSYSGSFNFHGAGAGTITPGTGTAGTISGTAAGTAK
jgi:hypothetical protein